MDNYADLARLHEGAQAVVYRARRTADGHSVLLKLLRGPRPTPEATARFRREHELTMLAQGPGVVECLGFEEGSEPALVLNDAGARALAEVIADGRLDVGETIRIGLQLATAFARLHASRIIHRDVSPSNIVWNAKTSQVQIIDFGIATQTVRQASAENQSSLLGTLAYMAPEQSGRMNRSVDSRSDLYSLGATLYHLATGRPPFVAQDPLDLVHAHLARIPQPAHVTQPEVPPSLSAILDRLLAKSADDRYQSADGVAADLQTCLERWIEGDGSEFPLGEADGSTSLVVSERLYGRDGEIAELQSAFNRARVGPSELILVGGPSGIGKTRLVNQLQPTLLERRASWITGKHDQFHRGTPYAALGAGLGRFVQSILSESPMEVARWRSIMLEAAGEHAGLLIDVVPEAELLIGEQAKPTRLPAVESETRFAFLIRRVVAAMASDTNPLVIFLDDLQWADHATMRLIQSLVSDPQSRHVLLVGAYRDNEIEAGHPLTTFVDDLSHQGARVSTISLDPLTVTDASELIGDSLHRDADSVGELATLLHTKSGGNPFFLVRLLESLADEDVIWRDPTEHRWVWDLDVVSRVEYTDNVVEFLSHSLVELPEETQRALGIGALLGERFELRDVANLADWSLSVAASHLHPALAKEMVSRTDASLALESQIDDDLDVSIRPTYRFAHDRVQQAARGLISEDVVPVIRASIARRLRDSGAAGNDLFDLAEHLLGSLDQFTSSDEQVQMARLLHEAGNGAAASAAFAPALRYFDGAWNLLGPNPWTRNHDLARSIALDGAESAHLVGEADHIEGWTNEVIENCDDTLSVLAAHDIAIQGYNARQELIPAIERAIATLLLIDVKVPADPGQPDILRGLARTKMELRKFDSDALAALPDCTDEEILAAQRILMRISVSAYYARPDLLPLLAFKMVQLTLRHGVSAESPFGFSVWGLVLCSIGQIDKGVEAGNVAQQLNLRSDSPRLRHRSRHLYNAHLRMWKEPWQDCRDTLRETHRACWDGGDLVYAAFAAFMSTTMSLYIGDPLREVARVTEDFGNAIRSLQNDNSLQTTEMTRQAAYCLMGRAPQPQYLRGEAYDESEMLAVHEAADDTTNLFLRGMYGAHLAYLFNEHTRAAELLNSVDKYKDGAASTVYTPVHQFLVALSNAGAMRDPNSTAKSPERKARKALKKLRTWAAHAPHNLSHRVALVEAELARSKNDMEGALTGYEKAISDATRYGWLADLALASELAARFHLDEGRAAIGRGYLLDARQHYAEYGAAAKVDQLDATFPQILQGASISMAPRSSGSSHTTSTGSTNLDAVALIEAAAAISGEVHVDFVVEALVRLSVEIAGASRGALVVVETGAMTVRAVAHAADEVTVESVEVPVADFPCLQAAVAYAARTRHDVIINDAAADTRWAGDTYMDDSGVRSVLVVPVVHQQRLIAVLYLENDLTTDAFPADQVATVRALAAQSGISVQNAQLYQSLEEQVRERTSELLVARREAETQRDRADRLLENVLPEPIARELKQTGRAAPLFVPSATVLFTDFKGFTELSGSVSPEELVAELERIFTAFDRIMDRRGVEKLKTVGDAYMAVGGLPVQNDTHATDAVLAALDIVEWMKVGDEQGPPSLEVRIGIHTGPLVAGVIGERRFLYDVWGDTVNVASRMESSGEPGKINISGATRDLIGDRFACTHRGLIEAKGKGELDMWFVDADREQITIVTDRSVIVGP